MNIRQVQALVMLYRACADAAIRRRADTLVPELSDWDTEPTITADPVERRYRVSVHEGGGVDGKVRRSEIIYCTAAQLDGRRIAILQRERRQQTTGPFLWVDSEELEMPPR